MLLQRVIDWFSSRAQRLLLSILASGPVPKHVAFIMDGNRRYARSRSRRVQEGHMAGYDALKRILELCLRLNIQCVSVYAFAMDNFKRPREEVDALLELAKNKLVEMCMHGELLDEYGVRLNIIGRKELFPEDVRIEMKRAEDMTRHNTRSILNVCLAYASSDEITSAVESSVRLSFQENSGIGPHIIAEDIDSQLYTSLVGSPPLDILVRSSGVSRLSDFMLWQCCDDTQIHFSKTYWPDFGFLDLMPVILDFQRKVWSKGVQRTLS